MQEREFLQQISLLSTSEATRRAQSLYCAICLAKRRNKAIAPYACMLLRARILTAFPPMVYG
jgi:hypothetical protein